MGDSEDDERPTHVQLNLRGASVEKTAQTIARITGKNVFLSGEFEGIRITVVSSTPVKVEVAYEMILSALQEEGLNARRFRRDNLLRIYRSARCVLRGTDSQE